MDHDFPCFSSSIVNLQIPFSISVTQHLNAEMFAEKGSPSPALTSNRDLEPEDQLDALSDEPRPIRSLSCPEPLTIAWD